MEEKFLSEKQIGLARMIAEYYFAPLGTVLKLMVPKAVEKRKTGKIAEAGRILEKRKMGKTALEIIKSRKNIFFLAGKADEREKINVDLIQSCLEGNKQCLILVPEIFFSHSVYEKLSEYFSGEIALIHSRITKGQFYDQWKKIKSGEIKIVIASKLGIFLPFLNLGLIIIQEEQDVSFKQQESMPRYSAVRGAEFLSQISGAKLVLESLAPSVGSLYRVQKKELDMAEAKNEKSLPAYISSLLFRAGNFPKVEIIAWEKEKNNPDFPISKILASRLAEVLKNKKQVVVFMNRRGFSTRTICENCKKTLKCPKCDRALVYSENQGEYRCLHCSYKLDILSACPSCGGFRFSHRGIGTQTVEKKIRQLFPSARVVRLDADILQYSKKHQKIIQKFSQSETDILVGTQSAVKGIYSDNIELAASISDRDFSDGLEFGSREAAFSRFFHMANLLNGNGILAVQSFSGRNFLFDCLKAKDLERYYAEELAVRKKFSYPPFRKFVKLICRDKSEKKVGSEAKKTLDLLRKADNNKIEIIGPYAPVSSQKKGLYQRNILIKFSPELTIGNLSVRTVIGGLRKGWSVDVDPVTILQ